MSNTSYKKYLNLYEFNDEIKNKPDDLDDIFKKLAQYATPQNTDEPDKPDEPKEPSIYNQLIELFKKTLEYYGAYDQGWKDSYLGIDVTAFVNDGYDEEGRYDIEGRVVHPGDSGLRIGELIRITPTTMQEKRWNYTLKGDERTFYVTSPNYTRNVFEYICISETEDVEVDNIQEVESVLEEKHHKLIDGAADGGLPSSNTIDLEYVRERDKRLDSYMRSMRSMIDIVDEKLFKVKFNQFIGSLKISEKIKVASNGDPEEVKKYYEALRMFYDGRMHKKKMKNAVKYYDRDMEVFKSLHGIANRHSLAHKKWF